jgi:hypothetical protein
VDYAVGDNIFFYCRYCGKKHKFDLTKAIDKSVSNDDRTINAVYDGTYSAVHRSLI